MNRIPVNGSTKYDVIIMPGCLGSVGGILRDEVGGERACIISDANVASLYINTVADTLREAGYSILSTVLPAGDSSKNFDNYLMLCEELAAHEFERSDVIIALGGGMIGDIAGFVASSFKRGIRLVQIPTTLLAAVDSSVGGKTAINLPLAKNQIGSFYNPSLVVCDPAVLSTLPDSVLREGYAEIIKYGILSGHEIIDELRRACNDTHDYSEVIKHSVKIKRDIVEMDEHDNSFRQYLNLGHLVGHAIEASSSYVIPHGYAVAQGIAIEARACAHSGYISLSKYIEITCILNEFGFDLSDSYQAESLLPYIYKDKRLHNSSIMLIVPVDLGECAMKELPASELPQFIRRGL